MKAIIFSIIISFALLQSCGNKKNTYQGYIVGINTYISPQFEGKLKKLAVQRGDKVEKGALLFTLDDKPQVFILNETKATLQESISQLIDLSKPRRTQRIDIIRAKIKQVEAQIHLAQLRKNRYQALFDKKVLAKDSLDVSQEHLNELLAKNKQFESELELAKLGARPDILAAKKSSIQSLKMKIEHLSWVLSAKVEYSPDTGLVYDTFYVEDELVTTAKPVVALLFPKNIYIEFFVPFDKAKELHIGQEIEYTFMGENKSHKIAKLIYISPEAEYLPPLVYSRDNANKIVFKIKAKPVNDELLNPGIPVTIKIDAQHA